MQLSRELPRCQHVLTDLAGLTLTLLVPGVIADNHDTTAATDDLAVIADPLNARLDLHLWCFLCRDFRRSIADYL